MLKTRPDTGTYYPPKCMLDGQWKYLVGVTEWHDHEHDAQEAHRLQAANRDCIAHFDVLKADFDRFHSVLERISTDRDMSRAQCAELAAEALETLV